MRITLETTINDVLEYQKNTLENTDTEIIRMLMDSIPKAILMPQEPKLKSLKPSNDEIDKYKSDSLNYSTAIEKYKIDKEQAISLSHHIDQLIIDFIKEQTGFNKHVPTEAQEKVWSKACDLNNDGFFGLYDKVETLTDLYI